MDGANLFEARVCLVLGGVRLLVHSRDSPLFPRLSLVDSPVSLPLRLIFLLAYYVRVPVLF